MAKPSFYFYCLPQGHGSRPAYQYPSIVLAQGLKALGCGVHANIDYWRQGDGTHLFTHDPHVPPDDCSVVMVPCQWRAYGLEYPEFLFKQGRPYKTVMIDICDDFYSPAFEPQARSFDLILKQKNTWLHYPNNCRSSWVFGISDEIMAAASKVALPFASRQRVIMHNARHTHCVRALAQERFLQSLNMPLATQQQPFGYEISPAQIAQGDTPEQRLHLQSGGRHHPDYLKQMGAIQVVAGFGGIFAFNWEVQPILHQLANYLIHRRSQGRLVQLLEKLRWQFKHTRVVYQWDSWRLWEAWAMGCVVLHLDFDCYGIELPVMPKNYEHYVGVDLQNPTQSIDFLHNASQSELAAIAAAGHAWAIQHYSPIATAQRLLDLLH